MKKIIFFTLVIICLLVMNNLLRSIYTTWQKQSFLTEAQRSVEQEQERHQQLELQLKTVSQKDFVEEQARDKLLLVKPGEQLVILPSNLLPVSTKQQSPSIVKLHWQEWLAYFSQ